MVKNTANTVISGLQSVSEGALGKLTSSQATKSAVQGAMQLKDRGDRILRGLESIEERLTAIEKRLTRSMGSRRSRPRRAPARPRASRGRRPRSARPTTRAKSSLAAGTRKRSAAGHDLEPRPASSRPPRRRARPAAAPRRSTSSAARAQHVDARVLDVAAAVELRRGRHEVELRHVADQHDVEQAVVGLRRRERASSRRRASVPFATITSCIRPRRSPPSKADRHLGVLPGDELARERVVERRPTAERLRHRVRAPGDRAAHPDRADVGEEPLASTSSGREHRPADVDRRAASRRARPRTASSNFVGIPWVRPKSWPVPFGSTAISASDAGDPVDDLVQRPVAADDDDQLGPSPAASRASSVRWPGRSESSASPSSPSSRARSAQLRPALRRSRRSRSPG